MLGGREIYSICPKVGMYVTLCRWGTKVADVLFRGGGVCIAHAGQGLGPPDELVQDSCVHTPNRRSPRLLTSSLCLPASFPASHLLRLSSDTVIRGQEEHIVSVSRDGTLKVWDRQGVELTSIPAHSGPISQCAAALEPRPGIELSPFPLRCYLILLGLLLFLLLFFFSSGE